MTNHAPVKAMSSKASPLKMPPGGVSPVHGNFPGLARVQRAIHQTSDAAIQRACSECGATDALEANPGIQPKLKVGPAGDRFEQEADNMADKVMRMADPGIFKSPSSPAKNQVQAKGASGGAVSPKVASSIQGLRGGGTPLPKSSKAFFEPRFGQDFSKIRLHTDAKAAGMADSIQAKAFTLGNDIAFARGAYNPESNSGKQLLAHELTHTVQQSSTHLKHIRRAEIDDRPEHCKNLKDVTSKLDDYVNKVLGGVKGINDGEKRVEAVYSELGKGSPFSKIEDWVEALSSDYQNRLPIKNTRFRGGIDPMFLAGQPFGARKGSGFVNAWDLKGEGVLGTTLKLGNECIGSDKLGHFFQQGRDYFKISTLLGKGDSYAKGFGEWLEGKSPSDPDIQNWIKQMDSKDWPGFDGLKWGLDFWKGVFGLSTSGVFSNADLTANTAGMAFYKRVYASPNITFSAKGYVTGNWNEVKNPSCFGPDLARLLAINDPAFRKNHGGDLNIAWRTYLIKASNTKYGISLTGKEELRNTVKRLVAPYVAKYTCP